MQHTYIIIIKYATLLLLHYYITKLLLYNCLFESLDKINKNTILY